MSGDNQLPVRVRWLMRQDMLDVLRIEFQSFEFPWCDDDFLRCLRQRNCIGMVAEAEEYRGFLVVGFMLYELNKGELELLNIAVDPQFRRRKVGQQMMARLVDKLGQQQRTKISATVRETNVDAQLFFRSQGFRVVDQIPGHYEETDEDGYQFLFNAVTSHHSHSVG
jgi:ribosomal-protein-alanine N-acetyltransferase